MLDLPPKRRAAARRAFQCACYAIHWGRFTVIGERLLDLSAKGAMLACDEEVRLGDEVLLTFRMPWQGPAVLVVGQVTRMIDGRRDGDPGYCAGLEFVDMSDAERGELRRRLAMFEPTEAARPVPVDYARTLTHVAHIVPEHALILAD